MMQARKLNIDFFSYSRGMKFVVYLLALWFLLHMADLFTTYQALSTGLAAEANPLMCAIIEIPVLAVILKMSAAYLGAKIIERMAARNVRFTIATLIVVNAFIGGVCMNNLSIFLRLSGS